MSLRALGALFEPPFWFFWTFVINVRLENCCACHWVGAGVVTGRSKAHSSPPYGRVNSRQYSGCHLECFSVQGDSFKL